MVQTIKKQITFLEPLYKAIEKKASEKGVTFTEYIRHIALNSLEKKEIPLHKKVATMDSTFGDNKYITPAVAARLAKDSKKAEQDSKAGKTKVFKVGDVKGMMEDLMN